MCYAIGTDCALANDSEAVLPQFKMSDALLQGNQDPNVAFLMVDTSQSSAEFREPWLTVTDNNGYQITLLRHIGRWCKSVSDTLQLVDIGFSSPKGKTHLKL